LAAYLGKKKVGLLFAHPPREDGFFFSGFEVLLAAELQLESTGVNGLGLDDTDTTFTTIRMTLDSKQNELVAVEGYQVSPYMCIYVYMYISVYICVYVCIRIYLCISVCYTGMCVYIVYEIFHICELYKLLILCDNIYR